MVSISALCVSISSLRFEVGRVSSFHIFLMHRCNILLSHQTSSLLLWTTAHAHGLKKTILYIAVVANVIGEMVVHNLAVKKVILSVPGLFYMDADFGLFAWLSLPLWS